MPKSFELKVVGKIARHNGKIVHKSTFKSKGLIFEITVCADEPLRSLLLVSGIEEISFSQEFYVLLIAGVNGTITIEWNLEPIRKSFGSYVLEHDPIEQEWKIVKIVNHTNTTRASEVYVAE